MAVLTESVLFLVGLGLLVVGADRAVRSAGELAIHFGVSSFFVGVTVISIGTSIPEMVTSVVAASYGAGDLVVGNIVGSETAQITLAIGIVALIAPIVAERRNVLVYGGAMVVAMVIMMLTIEDAVVTRSEGVLMMLTYGFFIHELYTNEGGEEIAEGVIEEEMEPLATTPARSLRRTLPGIVVGLLFVVAGGQLAVTNGIALAESAGISQYLVGLLTGLGTTLPEVVVAGLAAVRGDGGISVGAILGSNITDPVFSLGVGALVADVSLTSVGSVSASVTYMLAVSLVVLALLYWRRGIDRPTGVLCCLLYVPTFFVL